MNRLVLLLVALLFSRVLCEGVPLRKLQVRGHDHNVGGPGHTELRSEKISDAALATQQANLKSFDKGGSTKQATGYAAKMTAAATDLSVSHSDQHSLERGGRRLAAANIGPYESETTGLDTAMAASAAITKAVQTPSKGSAKFATDVGLMTGRLATHRPTPGQVDTAAGLPLRKLLTHGNSRHNDGGSQAEELRSEKLSDSVLGTHEAILKVSEKGSINKATAIGAKMTAAATDPTVSHRAEQDLDTGGRRLAAANIGPYESETTGLDTAMAASAAITKAVQTPSKGSAKFATDVGLMTGRLATHRPTPGQVDTAAGLPLRKLLTHGNSRHNDGGSQAEELRSEKLSDSVLGTHEAILKVSEKGSINKATAIGAKMTAAATDPTVSHHAEQDLDTGGRRLAAANIGPYESETTGLDTAMAASAAITKAVQTPSKGSAKFATDVGLMTGRLATHRPTPGQVDTAAGLPLRKLLTHGNSRHNDGGSQAEELRSEKLSDSVLGTHEAILKVSEKGSISKATAIGAKMTAAATDPTVSHREEHMMDGGRRLMARRLMGL